MKFETRKPISILIVVRTLKAAPLLFVRRSLSMAATKHALIWPRHQAPEFM